MSQQEQNLGESFGKLVSVVLNGVSEALKVKEDVKEEVNESKEESNEPEIDISAEEKIEEEETLKEKNPFDLSSLFTKENLSKIEATLNSMTGPINDILNDVNTMMKARVFFLEQLNTCAIPEATQKTIEKFNLTETAKFKVDVVVSLH